ncbi:MAG: hypothetical protein P8J01_02355 [Acidimicrobiales bacterium]|nr:hypothetical protein [Acidimicrobiales bacterium]
MPLTEIFQQSPKKTKTADLGKKVITGVFRFVAITYRNTLRFGLGRRVNFSAIKKINVTTTGARVGLNAVGGFLISMGATMVVLADLGAGTTDVVLTGISATFSVSHASASFAFFAVICLIMLATRSKIGAGTILLSISVSATFCYSFILVPEPSNFGTQLLYFIFGLFVIATGVGIGASAGIGMGAFEAICHRLSEISGWHSQKIRLVWEITLLGIGIALGGAFGPGTLIAAIATGWILKYMNVFIGDYLLGRRLRTDCQQPIARGHSYEY